MLVTDAELNVLGEGVDVIIKPSDEALAQMGDFVRNMHTSSGLLDELAGGIDDDRRGAAGAGLRQGARARGPQGAAGRQHDRHRPCLPGPGHAEPRRSCALPQSWTSPRSRSSPAAGTRGSTSTPRPRAATTARWPTSARAIEELRYYREAVFVPPPGPDTATAGHREPSSRARLPGDGRPAETRTVE